MSIFQPPEYKGIFQYMVEKYDDPGKPTALERFWVNDLENNLYKKLEGPVARQKVHFGSAEEAAKTLSDLVTSAGADLVGFTRVSDEMVFKGANVEGKYAVSIGFQMDHGKISTSPDPPAGKEALRVYWRLGIIVSKVSQFIRSMGYQAQGHEVRTYLDDPPTILSSVVAEKAGMGEFGRIGLLITPEFGPRIRFGTITTELELPDTGRRPFGVEDFCSNCTICADACAGEAIPREKSLERGHLKYTIDPYKCIPEFSKYDGCSICVAVCPFNRPFKEMEWFLAGVKRLKDQEK